MSQAMTREITEAILAGIGADDNAIGQTEAILANLAALTVTGPPDDYTGHLKEAAHEVLSMTDSELHYLRSILGNLRELHSLMDDTSLGLEVLADNIDWLDCFIDKHERAVLEPKP